jgi:hypothetical protein
VSVALQWAAAVLVLAAFGAAQFGYLSPVSHAYLLANLLGGAGLAAAAALTHQWGFVLLEGVWAAVAGWSLLCRLQGRQPRLPGAHAKSTPAPDTTPG